MALPSLPPQGSTSWYSHYAAVSAKADESATIDNIRQLEAQLKLGQGWWDKTFSTPLAEDTPTTSLIVGEPTVGPVIREMRLTGQPTIVDIQNDTAFLWDGSPTFQQSGGNAAYIVAPVLPDGDDNNRYTTRISTITSTGNTIVEIRVRSFKTNMGYRISINDKWLPYTTHKNVVSGTVFTIRLQFPVGKSRKITLEHPSHEITFGGMSVPSGETLTRAAKPKLRVANVGASFVGGVGEAPSGATRMEVYSNYLAKLLGADSLINLGIGGSGWLTTRPYLKRVEAAVALSPDILIIEGSRNDPIDGPAIKAAVTSCLQAASAVPRLYVIGPATFPGQEIKIDAVQSATMIAGRQYINPAAGNWLTPELIGPDNQHPNLEGHMRYASRAYAEIR